LHARHKETPFQLRSIAFDPPAGDNIV
jgi:hypothetical protein